MEKDMSSFFNAFIRDESGASAAEYALILALIAIAIITGATAVGGAINGKLSASAGSI
jgi:pilus assembly protein Flp/PilA